jgi:D-glycero-D-manno-heptose 1,7-bisphosphate phosphatase
MNRAIFLDRDGVIIEEKGYICHLSQSAIFPFAAGAIRKMNEAGFKVIGITNQSAIARGLCSKEEVEQLHADIQGILGAEGAVIDRFYYCPYLPGGVIEAYRGSHPWRKPQPGMLLQAAKDFGIDLGESYMIGDSAIDIEAGRNAGCKTILVLTGKGFASREELEQRGISPDYITGNIQTAVECLDI